MTLASVDGAGACVEGAGAAASRRHTPPHAATCGATRRHMRCHNVQFAPCGTALRSVPRSERDSCACAPSTVSTNGGPDEAGGHAADCRARCSVGTHTAPALCVCRPGRWLESSRPAAAPRAPRLTARLAPGWDAQDAHHGVSAVHMRTDGARERARRGATERRRTRPRSLICAGKVPVESRVPMRSLRDERGTRPATPRNRAPGSPRAHRHGAGDGRRCRDVCPVKHGRDSYPRAAARCICHGCSRLAGAAHHG
jgi:hypothetical protein